MGAKFTRSGFVMVNFICQLNWDIGCSAFSQIIQGGLWGCFGVSQHLNEYQVKQIALPSVGNLIQSNRDLNRIKKVE